MAASRAAQRQVLGALGLHDGGRPRAAEQVALTPVAAQLTQPRQLERRLQAFGDHGDAERVAEVDDRLDDRRVLAVEPEPGDEAAVDLDRLDGEPLEVRQRRVPGPEVVDGEVEPEAAQVAQRDRRRLDVGQQGRLGDLQPQRVGGDPGLGEQVGDQRGERRVDDLAGADVDGQRGVGERAGRVLATGRTGSARPRGSTRRSPRPVRSPRPSAGTGPGSAAPARGAATGPAPRSPSRGRSSARRSAGSTARPRPARPRGAARPPCAGPARSSRGCRGRTPRRSPGPLPWRGTSRRRRRAAGRRQSPRRGR